MEKIGRKILGVPANSALLIFPMAALLNSFSMTALLLVFGIAGRSEIAANIGIVQGATLALFYAFSANARNLILADTTGSAAARLLQTRLLLMLPLSGAAYFLSVGLGDAAAPLALALIVRRMSEWMGEIGLARHEQEQQLSIASKALMVEISTFLVCLLPLFLDWSLAVSAIPWALAPLLATRRAQLSWRNERSHFTLRALLPHFGSTAIIGTSVYVFRISIVLLAGKAMAGDLFTAFAIGGMVPTIYGQALAPTLAHRFGAARLPKWLLTIPAAMLLSAAGITALALAEPAWLVARGRPPLFWLAVGLSIAGGAMMSVAAALRTRLIQQTGGEQVFGPDLLSNVLIAACVPFVFHVLGSTSLAGLYALSGFLSLAFLAGVGWRRQAATKPVLLSIGLLLLIPVFFQIHGGLFRDTAYVFNTGGSILSLPIPVAVLTLFGGIALLGNYAEASKSLAVLFFTALLFVTSSLTLAQGNAAQEGAKLILLTQFLLPMFGLVLGQMYGASTPAPVFERAALWMLVLILPAQLVGTWLQGYTLLVPSVFFFSIYQHLQYFPMIVVALLMMVSQALWRTDQTDRIVLSVLLPIAMIYVAAALSWGAVVGLILCLTGFAITKMRGFRFGSPALYIMALATIFAATYVGLSESGILSKSLSNADGPRETLQWQNKLSTILSYSKTTEPALNEGRMDHWNFYARGIVESPRTFFLGHATPPDRNRHPSAHNYWLDALYNFGAIATLPLITLLLVTIRQLWRQRAAVLSRPMLLGPAMALLYLLAENMLKVGMRQPYPGIITFFIWGLLIARLQIPSTIEEKNVSPIA